MSKPYWHLDAGARPSKSRHTDKRCWFLTVFAHLHSPSAKRHIFGAIPSKKQLSTDFAKLYNPGFRLGFRDLNQSFYDYLYLTVLFK